ncbi:MAG: inorganic phosphate transporter [bacterium]
MLYAAIIIGVVFLAYANGSNDNFKGVATLFGSNTTNYRTAITWATFTTLAGAICSIFLAKALLKNFTGKGLVPDSIVTSPEFVLAVAIGAAATVLLATFTGFPISTTHSITGALVGSGLMASGADVNFFRLGGVFFLPLLLSPFIALALASMLYSILHFLRLKFGITSKSFVIVEEEAQVIPNRAHSTAIALEANPKFKIGIQTGHGTETGYSGAILGIGLQKLVDVAHFLSAGAVGFARGLNDTPKIVALLIGLQVLEIHWAIWIVAMAMAAGGLLNARKVAVTMSKKISSFNDGQGLTALLVTSFLVIFSSVLAFPVSTTHVSVGSITGIGLANGTANKDKISSIGLSWILTLPIAAGISALAYAIISI